MTAIRIIILSFSLLINFSCNHQFSDKTILEGRWEDVSGLTLLGGEKYEFTFEDNTFWIKKYIYTDVAFEFCKIASAKNDYYGGFFSFDKDSIYLKGIFVKSAYYDSNNIEQNLPDCNHKYGTPYLYTYNYILNNDTLKLRIRESYNYGDNNFSDSDSAGAKILKRLTIFLKRKQQ